MKVMKKLDYIAPEQKVIELKYHETLLAGSAGSEIAGGTDNPEEFAPEMGFDFEDDNTFTFKEETFNFED